MKTIIQLEVEHSKPLPPDATDIAAQRVYGWLFSRGIEAGVKAKLMEEVPAAKQKWEQG